MLKIRKISRDEIMVYLSNADLDFFKLDPDNIAPQSSELHDFLFILMETVQDETGFDPYHGQVMVEAVPASNGLHITISKVDKENKQRKITRDEFKRAKKVKVVNTEASISDAMPKKREKTVKDKMFVFVFDCFADLEGAICVVSEDELKKSVLLRCKKRYAIVTGKKPDLKFCNTLSEFSAVSSKNSLLINDIKEGWDCVAEGNELVEMACNLRAMH